jgi:hypothetical protein
VSGLKHLSCVIYSEYTKELCQPCYDDPKTSGPDFVQPDYISSVDGNTDGNWYNNSTTSTRSEQGAWWQVDLGSKKIINQILE